MLSFLAELGSLLRIQSESFFPIDFAPGELCTLEAVDVATFRISR